MESVIAVSTGVDVKSIAKSVAKHSAITLSVAGVYFAISQATPQISNTLTMVGFDKTLRFANALRALALTSPAGIIGTGAGAVAVSSTAGQPDLFLPAIMVSIGLTIFGFSKAIGRGLLRDVTLLSLYGAIGGFLVTMKKLSVALLLTQATGVKFMAYLFSYKMWTSIAIYLLGYALIRGYEFVRGR